MNSLLTALGFFPFKFTNYDTFAQVLIIKNGLLLYLFIFALLIVNKN